MADFLFSVKPGVQMPLPDGNYITIRQTRLNRLRIRIAKWLFRFVMPKATEPLSITTTSGV